MNLNDAFGLQVLRTAQDEPIAEVPAGNAEDIQLAVAPRWRSSFIPRSICT